MSDDLVSGLEINLITTAFISPAPLSFPLGFSCLFRRVKRFERWPAVAVKHADNGRETQRARVIGGGGNCSVAVVQPFDKAAQIQVSTIDCIKYGRHFR